MSSHPTINLQQVRSVLIWAWPILLTSVGVVLALDDVFRRGTPTGEVVPGLTLGLVFTYLGTLIAVRQAGNRIALLLLGVGLGILITGATAPNPDSGSFLTWVALVLENWVGLNLILFPLVLIPYLFPTGQYLTSRQAWVGRLGLLAGALNFLAAVLVEEIGPAFAAEEDYWSISSPVGFLPSEVLDIVLTAWGLALVVVAFGGLWSLMYRYRRSTAEVRAQIRWMLLASLLVAIGFVLIVVMDPENTLAGVFVSLTFASVPVAITIAITRFRLYEIDRIISRTISYAFVVALLVGVYFGGVALVTSLLPTQNSIAVAASTLAVATLFNPVRRRVQSFVDRRFNRSRYDQIQLTEAFSSRLQEQVEVDSEQVENELVEAVVAALAPEAIGVWVADRPGGR